MSGNFAYSYNGENYIGRFNSRREALAEALRRVDAQPERPLSVYVGRIHTIDPKMTGHAESIITEMRKSAIANVGEAGDDYLRRATPQQITELDREIGNTIHIWLQRHELASAAFRVEEISERPVPPPADTARKAPHQSEVQDLGPIDAAIGE